MKIAFTNTGISLIVLGMLSFLANYGSANSLFLALVLCFLYSLLISRLFGEDEDDEGSISLSNFLGVTFAALIFLSAPLWDENNYCAKQISTKLVYEARTLEDVIKDRQRTDVAIYSDSDNCIKDGGWTYMGGYEKFLFFVVLVIQLGLFFMIVIPFIQWQNEERAKKNLSPQQKRANKQKDLSKEIDNINRVCSRIRRDKDEYGIDYFRNGLPTKLSLTEQFIPLARKAAKDKIGEGYSKKEVKNNLTWVIKYIPKMYSSNEKSKEVGAKKLELLKKLLEEIN